MLDNEFVRWDGGRPCASRKRAAILTILTTWTNILVQFEIIWTIGAETLIFDLTGWGGDRGGMDGVVIWGGNDGV